MATLKIADLLDQCSVLLQDTTHTRWPLSELLGWANAAYREIVLDRPDASSKSGTFTCAEGSKQVLTTTFSNATRLLDVTANVAATSDKGAIYQVPKQMLDLHLRTWRDTTNKSVNVRFYAFDPRVPTEFLVYPPATTAAQLEVLYAEPPAGHIISGETVPNEVIKLADSYANMVIDLVLYRAFDKDAEYAGNAQRAMSHYQAYKAAVGSKTQTDTVITPSG